VCCWLGCKTVLGIRYLLIPAGFLDAHVDTNPFRAVDPVDMALFTPSDKDRRGHTPPAGADLYATYL
jgi:hypothetical protein